MPILTIALVVVAFGIFCVLAVAVIGRAWDQELRCSGNPSVIYDGQCIEVQP